MMTMTALMITTIMTMTSDDDDDNDSDDDDNEDNDSYDDDNDVDEFGQTLIGLPQICLPIDQDSPHNQSTIIQPQEKRTNIQKQDGNPTDNNSWLSQKTKTLMIIPTPHQPPTTQEKEKRQREKTKSKFEFLD